MPPIGKPVQYVNPLNGLPVAALVTGNADGCVSLVIFEQDAAPRHLASVPLSNVVIP